MLATKLRERLPLNYYMLPKTQAKSRFSLEEDDLIVKFVKEFGTSSWNEASKLIKNKTPRQCKERWNYYLNPDINNSPWTSEEDAILIETYEALGPKWVSIASKTNRRTDAQCKNRFLQLRRKAMTMENLLKTFKERKTLFQLFSSDITMKTPIHSEDSHTATSPHPEISLFDDLDFAL